MDKKRKLERVEADFRVYHKDGTVTDVKAYTKRYKRDKKGSKEQE